MYEVPFSHIALLRDPPFVLWLFLLSLALGKAGLRFIKAPLDNMSGLEKLALYPSIGFGLLAFIPFILGMSGQLRPDWMLATLIALSLLLCIQIIHLLISGGRWVITVLPLLKEWKIFLPVLLLSALVLTQLGTALSPCLDDDGLAYHLSSPKIWLTDSYLSFLPTRIHADAPVAMEMLYTIAIALWSDTSAKLIHYTFGILSLLAIFISGKRLLGQTTGFLAAFLWLIGFPKLNVLGEFGWAYVDLALATMVVLTFFCWGRWRATDHMGWLRTASLCAGLSCAFKLTGAFVIITLCVITLLAEWRKNPSQRNSFIKLTTSLLLSLLPVFPWLLREWIQTGNPFYPFAYAIFPTHLWNRELANGLDTYFKYYNWFTYTAHDLTLHQRMLARFSLMLLCMAAFLYAAISRRCKPPEELIAGLSLLACFAVYSTGLYIRLLIHLYPLVCLLLAYRICLPGKWRKPLLSLTIIYLVFITIILMMGISRAVALDWSMATGRVTRDDYLKRNLPEYSFWKSLEGRLPPDSRILIMSITEDYYSSYRCERLIPLFQAQFRLSKWSDFKEDIAAAHIQYIITDDYLGFPSVFSELYPATANYAVFRTKLQNKYSSLVFASGSYKVFRLNRLQ